MKKLFILASLLLSQQHIYGQCAGGRYLDYVFSSVTLDSVVYSDTFGLKLDVYQPAGDTLAARPLIILAHGGSFVEGDREDDVTVDSLCVRLAKRGYVTASIDYRLGNTLEMVLDSSAAINEVIQAMGDGKAAIRFFAKDAATINNYKIDTNNIYIGGNSAGAVLYMQVGYVGDTAVCPADIRAALDANGGFEGNSGNAGYSSKTRGIIDLAGGLNETSFVASTDEPSVNAQGSLDSVVPYTCGLALDGEVKVTLCGLGSLEPVYDAQHVYHMSYVFPGAGHVPWQTDDTEFNTVDSLVTQFLYSLTCSAVAGVNEVQQATDVQLFPNPTDGLLNLKASESIKDLSIFDETGRLVYSLTDIDQQTVCTHTTQWSEGVYYVKINFYQSGLYPIVRSFSVISR